MVTSFPAVHLNTPEKVQQDRGTGEAGERCRSRSQFSFVSIITVRRGRYKHVAPAESGPCLCCALDTRSRQGLTAGSSSAEELMLIPTLQIFAEKRPPRKSQGKKLPLDLSLYFLLIGRKLARETALCGFIQFKVGVDYLLICFKLHKTVFLVQG